MKQLTVGKNSASQRADKFILKAFPSLPPALMYKAFRKKDIKVNGKWIKENYFLSEGDILSVYLPDDVLAPKSFTPSEGSIDIVYEDENICIIDKPAGVPCQSGGQSSSAPLAEIFKTYLYNKGEYIPENEQSFAPALCNRIDTNTKGLVIGAKNAAALRVMNEAIRQRQVHKFYLCLTERAPEKSEDTVILKLSKDSSKNKTSVSDNGTLTETRYKVIKKTERGALCSVELLTGKSHQIRAVMAHIGCPLVGDAKYGAKASGGQALVSHKLIFSIKDPLLSYLNGKTFYSKYTLSY